MDIYIDMMFNMSNNNTDVAVRIQFGFIAFFRVMYPEKVSPQQNSESMYCKYELYEL